MKKNNTFFFTTIYDPLYIINVENTEREKIMEEELELTPIDWDFVKKVLTGPIYYKHYEPRSLIRPVTICTLNPMHDSDFSNFCFCPAKNCFYDYYHTEDDDGYEIENLWERDTFPMETYGKEWSLNKEDLL